ncbi:hypothetical protein K435DRAFT_869141 [Dendrothele bispora CBS 962.96]|uniref:Uncharacterized protein n=1 Tax=Dendrothele bispora (strain CBS 962.96) TaxID=1314807 RepID=A0A4S8L9V7_DENBC|nr:hypothetical protein K435DRAFT_869141 [Dendrothele bispora CBS 962.96]
MLSGSLMHSGVIVRTIGIESTPHAELGPGQGIMGQQLWSIPSWCALCTAATDSGGSGRARGISRYGFGGAVGRVWVGLGEWERRVWLCYFCDCCSSIPRPWTLMKLSLVVRALMLKGLRRIGEERVEKEGNSSDTMGRMKLRVETQELNKLFGVHQGKKTTFFVFNVCLGWVHSFVHRVTLNASNPVSNVTWLLAFGVP